MSITPTPNRVPTFTGTADPQLKVKVLAVGEEKEQLGKKS